MVFKVVFNLDGSGVYYNPGEPIHLDSLLAWCLAPKQGRRDLQRSDAPDIIGLPLKKFHTGGSWVWRASALFPDGHTQESVQFWRKRFRQNRIELTKGSPNLTNGKYRDWQMPIPLLLTRRMIAYASGSRSECKKILTRELKYLGKKRAHGHGKILSMSFEEIDNDWSISKDGIAMRWIPDSNGNRTVRPIPPYWHPHGRIKCCEVGDSWDE